MTYMALDGRMIDEMERLDAAIIVWQQIPSAIQKQNEKWQNQRVIIAVI
jgi:hypothetical protein